MSTRTTTRQTAEERRPAVLAAATHEFAVKGFHGASTEEIARQAGISQPYLFRLFGSKKELYIAAAQRSIDAQYAAFAEAAKGKTGEAALKAMGEAYKTGIAHDRDHLMLMLKTWSSDDPDFRRLSRTAWRNIVDLAEQSSRESPEVVSRFFANGMLITILMSMGLSEDPEPWATRLLEACLEAIEE
jgi:AcrR family transcriptional regulator